MHTRPLTNTPLPTRMPEERPVRDRRLVGRNSSIPLIRIPSVQMRIQMNNRDGPVNRLQRSQNRQHNRVIPAQTHDPRMFPRVGRRGRVVEYLAVALFHLFESMGCVKGRDGYITTVDLWTC